jgi:phosphatidylinositol 4-phosphatase
MLLGLFPAVVHVLSDSLCSLDDARRATSVYAKMEYGVKRLLWLGG